MGKSVAEYVARVSERAHAIWEREGRPEGGAEHHWAQAEEEIRAEEQGQAGASGAGAEDAASTAGTETWTGPGSSVGGEPEAGDQGQAQTPAAEEAEVTGKTRRRAKG
jgi:hypothetical protein